jgi:hypothetical protein
MYLYLTLNYTYTMYLKSLLVAAFVVISCNAIAQSVNHIRLFGGIGGGERYEKGLIVPANPKLEVSALGGLTTSYDIGRFRINAGFSIASTSRKQTANVLLESDFQFDTTGLSTTTPTNYSYYTVLRYAGMPVSVGYIVPITEKIRVIPEIGAMPAITLPIIYTIINEETKEERTSKQKTGKLYNLFSLSGLGLITFEFDIAPFVSLNAGGYYTYQFTNMVSSQPKGSMREQTYGGTLGVTFRL